uniref:Aurora kinase A-interacting protein-like n=1 Tax=Salmo trutta TaxID=8032 RepID=A0A674B380_SALTR
MLEIWRRKMNRHKYKKLLKRTKFLRRRVLDGRRKNNQKRFEKDLQRIWMRAGLKKSQEEWNTLRIFNKQSKVSERLKKLRFEK